MKSKKTYLVVVDVSLVKGITAQNAEIEPGDLGKHFYHIEASRPSIAEKRALDEFHSTIPIGELDYVNIETSAELVQST